MRFAYANKTVLAVTGVAAAGLMAGGAAMYLLDPTAGRHRRAAISRAAQSAVHQAGEAIHHAGDTIHDAAISAGEKIGDLAAAARHATEQAALTAEEVAAFAAAAPAGSAAAIGLRRLFDSYHDSAHYLARRIDNFRHALDNRTAAPASHAAQPYIAPAIARAKSALARIGRSPTKLAKPAVWLIPTSVGGVACLAAGAGAMYLFDPERGHARRTQIRDGAVGVVQSVGRFVHGRARNVRSNAEGIARQVGLTSQRRISSRDYVSGEQLLLRVRDQIARTCQYPRLIQVMTDTFGSVTLTGEIADSERDRLLAAVRQTPGVRQLVERLTTTGASAPAVPSTT
jgi:hypothetical protein